MRYYEGGFVFETAVITDLMFCSGVTATPEEIQRIFNYGTNQSANYAARYPQRLLTNRFMHFPLGQSTDFQTIGPNLFATDVSGNNRHAQVFGQGTTPTFLAI
jgi:hypothetical protein